MAASDLSAIAKRTPLTRAAVKDFAAKFSKDTLVAHAPKMLAESGVQAASVLAFALTVHGAKLDPEFARVLLPELESIQHFAPLLCSTALPVPEIALTLLEDGRMSYEREALALFLAAQALDGAPPPATFLKRARFLSRHKLGAEAGLFLGGAAFAFDDDFLTLLATPHMNRAKRSKKVLQEWLDDAAAAPLEILSDTAGARISTGFTVKRENPSVGRNDPCPCGSGKKYKKCHAGAEEEIAAEAPAKIDAASIGPDQAAYMRPSEIEAIDRTRLSRKAFTEAFTRVVDYKDWDLVFRMIDEAKKRADLAPDVIAFITDALHKAFDSHTLAAAEKLVALLPPPEQEKRAIEITCLRRPPDLLATLEDEALAALHEDANGARGMLLAAALLRQLPALGIYVARGALHEGRVNDSQALLETIEDARDQLLLPPFEAWWDVYEGLVDEKDEASEKKSHAAREKLKDDLKRARAASRKATAEIAKLEARVEELDAIAVGPQPKTTKDTRAPEPSADLVEEKKRLKSKIDELQRIIGEGQEERRDLRRRLADVEEAEPRSASAPKSVEPTNDDPDPEGLHDEADVERANAILVPRFSERAEKVVSELASGPAEIVLVVVASLAAGRENAWSGVKQLTKVRGVFSARAGIHHRVLFRITADRGVSHLDVVEVIHRRELEQVVARLSRAS